VIVPRWYAVLLPAYLVGLLAIDTQVGLRGQLALGALTLVLLVVALRPLPTLVRAQAIGVVLFATVGEVTGSLVWGVYHYRLHNLPLFIPPAHGLVYLSGVALSRSVGARAVVWAAAIGAAAWGIAGLTLLPRLDVAGAFGVPLLLVFLWRSRWRATYAGVFLVVAALELYGTSIGTWRWAHDLPGLGIPDGNPPSGVASGYVWFDVMALLLAPVLLGAVRLLRGIPAERHHPMSPSSDIATSPGSPSICHSSTLLSYRSRAVRPSTAGSDPRRGRHGHDGV